MAKESETLIGMPHVACYKRLIVMTLLFSTKAYAGPAQSFDFGDDLSPFARDGVCDDIRFSGSGMANKPTPKSRTLEAAFRMMADANPYEAEAAQEMYRRGLAEQSRLDEMATERAMIHIRHDATDCRVAYEAGTIKIRPY